ncbi:bifunctional diguanylate cyclase/phosphodiesterase [Aneurinibacillus uraniidurans]|uniref:bifunctional diguanylate cyclase/phosphodiesterase n=1 Tax=Aneurinibacillus uraniidurans TaxID=2966586 RepID=UPI00234A8F3D|nr:bifunctional diguanylate cyclase/phosphodiesterase [Aneurinibacillus sp. B1]WCN37983.1 EAL domain-containing protein [Aneurinibacillus sp. B1]
MMRTIMDSIPDFVCFRDREGRWLAANSFALRFFGLGTTTYQGKTAEELTSFVTCNLDVFMNCTQSDKEVWATGKMMRIEQELRLPNGHPVFLDTVKVPVYKEDGQPKELIVIGRDVTMHKQAERLLKESEQRYRSLVEYNADAVFTHDLAGRFMSMNKATEGMTGYFEEELLYHTPFRMILPEDRVRAQAHFERAKEGKAQNYDVTIVHKSGRHVHVNVANIPIIVDEEVVGVYGIAKDITERSMAEKRVAYMAYHDELTGLINRRFYKQKLQEALCEAEVNESRMAILFMDMDRFKNVNDSMGHAFGDELLRMIADRLRFCLEEHHVLARLGGDEFTLLCRDVQDEQEVSEIANRIAMVLDDPFKLNGFEFHMTASMGISMYPRDGQDSETLMRHADIAMYHAKSQGVSYQYYRPGMNRKSHDSWLLERELRKGLEREEFTVYYQPQMNIATGKIIGAEALIRWIHPEKGFISPGEFIPLAEEIGLIVPLGNWVLDKACKQNKLWQEAGLPPIKVGVNLSFRQFVQQDLARTVADTLQSTGLDSSYLDLEITESMTMEVERAMEVLAQLRSLGVSISMDDFGTGYSSLTHLTKFPIDKLKIDQSFIRNITDGANDAAIAATIVTMAKNLKLRAIAEGVETDDQLQFLQQCGCDEIQGYWLSPPVPAEKFEQILASNSCV